jgi:hypothetical protein
MDNQIVGTYADVSMEGHVLRNRRLHNDTDGTVTEQECRSEIPEEVMSQLDPFVGDGNAHLTVSGALSSSQSFHKAEAFVSVSVTCNNNLDDVRQVHNLIRPFVQTLVLEDHNEMSVLRDQILPEEKRLHNEKGPSIAAEAQIKVSTPPQRSATVSARPGTPVKPTFGR